MSWKRLEVEGQLGSCCQRVWDTSSGGNTGEMQLSIEIFKTEKDLN